MDYKKPIEDILGDMIASMTFPVNIYKIVHTVVNGIDTYTLNVDNAYYAQVGIQNIIQIGGAPYAISGVAYASGCNTFDVITVQDNAGSGNITATSFNMYAPNYFYGTLNETGTELSQQSDASLKTPMIFLRLDETLEETFHNDPSDTHERLSNCQIAFLTQNDYNQTTSVMIPAAVTPMRRLMEIFVETLDDTSEVFEKWDFDFRVKYYTKVFVTQANKQLWSDKLSGCWATFPLKLLRQQ